MTHTPVMTDHEQLARKTLETDSHYLDSIAQMAAAQDVVAHEDVFAANGTKLIGKGVVIDDGLRERLVNHILLKPIDQSLEAQGGVDPAMLAQEAARLAASQPQLMRLLAAGNDLPACVELLGQLDLPPQLRFKLSVMRLRMSWMFDHALAAVLIAYFLARRLQFSSHQMVATVLAALMHDLGELHTDPALLDRRHRMNETELRHIDVHPITGYLIAKEILPDLPVVATAILQHQEKLDGSGYPYRLQGKQISLLARIVAVADAAASIMIRSGSSERLVAWMRLNRHKFAPELVALLQRGMAHFDDGKTTGPELSATEVAATAQLLLRWGEFSASMKDTPPAEIAFLFERMADLRVILLQFGLDPARPESIQALADEPEIARELVAAFDEVRRQITDIQRETQRRRNTLKQTLSADTLVLLDNWLAEISRYLQVAMPEGRVPPAERRHPSATT